MVKCPQFASPCKLGWMTSRQLQKNCGGLGGYWKLTCFVSNHQGHSNFWKTLGRFKKTWENKKKKTPELMSPRNLSAYQQLFRSTNSSLGIIHHLWIINSLCLGEHTTESKCGFLLCWFPLPPSQRTAAGMAVERILQVSFQPKHLE